MNATYATSVLTALVSLSMTACGPSLSTECGRYGYPVGANIIVVQPASIEVQSPAPMRDPLVTPVAIQHQEAAHHPLQAIVFGLPEGVQSVPDFEQYPRIGAFTSWDINVTPRNHTDGFPGVAGRTEWFGVRYTGSFTAPQTGNYLFRVNADDGAILRIDDIPVVTVDGIHPPLAESGYTRLEAGAHTVRVDYFQGPRDLLALQVFWTVPGSSEVPFTVQ